MMALEPPQRDGGLTAGARGPSLGARSCRHPQRLGAFSELQHPPRPPGEGRKTVRGVLRSEADAGRQRLNRGHRLLGKRRWHETLQQHSENESELPCH